MGEKVMGSGCTTLVGTLRTFVFTLKRKGISWRVLSRRVICSWLTVSPGSCCLLCREQVEGQGDGWEAVAVIQTEGQGGFWTRAEGMGWWDAWILGLWISLPSLSSSKPSPSPAGCTSAIPRRLGGLQRCYSASPLRSEPLEDRNAPSLSGLPSTSLVPGINGGHL